jgi:hypothetical protein
MIHHQFLTAALADEIHLAIAPFLVGDPAAPRFPGDGAFLTIRATGWNWPRSARSAMSCSCATCSTRPPASEPPARADAPSEQVSNIFGSGEDIG